MYVKRLNGIKPFQDNSVLTNPEMTKASAQHIIPGDFR